MIHEAFGHLGERLSSLSDEVRLLDQRLSEVLVFLALNPTAPSSGPKAAEASPAEKACQSPSLSKRVAALELGQQAIADATKRALRKAMTAQRLAQEQRRGSAKQSSATEDSSIDSRLKEQDWRIAQLDEQVNILAAHMQDAFADQVERAFSAASKKATEPATAPSRQTRATASFSPSRRSQTLIDIVDEAVAEAKTEELMTEARREANRLKAELLKVEAAARRSSQPLGVAGAKKSSRESKVLHQEVGCQG